MPSPSFCVIRCVVRDGADNQAGEITGHSWNNDQYQWTGASNGTRSYASNGLNRYTTAAGATLSYDTRGNLTKDGTWTYTFDLDNKLKTAARTGYSATLSYDAEGRLRRTVLAGATTDLLYDGTDLIAEYNSSGTLLRRYVHGPGIDEPLVWYEGTGTANRTWLYADHLGSIIGTANSAGTSTAIYRYGPFGEPNVTTGIRFRYTGQQYLGGLNLYYYKARFYSPTLGRFLQTDPIGTQDDLNLYAYVGNNPINFNDPDGLTAAELKMLAGKISDSPTGQFALGFAPGYDLYTAIRNPDASLLDYGVGILGIFPGLGKGAGLGIKAADNLAGAVAKGGGHAATGFKGSKGFEFKNAPYQKVRNEPTTINGHEFSGHALDQMQNRGIMPSVVENTIRSGQTFSTRAGTTGFYDSVNNVRVITNSETGRIVTVIRGAPN